MFVLALLLLFVHSLSLSQFFSFSWIESLFWGVSDESRRITDLKHEYGEKETVSIRSLTSCRDTSFHVMIGPCAHIINDGERMHFRIAIDVIVIWCVLNFWMVHIQWGKYSKCHMTNRQDNSVCWVCGMVELSCHQRLPVQQIDLRCRHISLVRSLYSW